MVNRKTKWWFWIGGAAIIAVGCTVYILWARPNAPVDNSASAARTRYAALYQAAWRQDDGRQPTLVTATLLVPPAITLLGQDIGRSNVEDQQYAAVKNLQSNQLAFVVTLDSVTSPLADDTITTSLTLSSTGTTWRLNSWTPLIAPSRVVNTNATTSSQIGVVIFDANATIDWTQLGALTLKVSLPSQKDRQLVWADPTLLLQVQ